MTEIYMTLREQATYSLRIKRLIVIFIFLGFMRNKGYEESL